MGSFDASRSCDSNAARLFGIGWMVVEIRIVAWVTSHSFRCEQSMSLVPAVRTLVAFLESDGCFVLDYISGSLPLSS
eukprot:scaffold150051_cov45-Attheya_sp.AAC.1